MANCEEDNLKFVTTSLQKDLVVLLYGKKEQKCKNKNKNRISFVRKARKLLADSNFAWDVIDRICPNSYGEKSLETIRFEDLKNIREGENDPSALRNISYLKMIGSLDTDEDILEDLLGEESGEGGSDSLDSWDK